MQVVKLIHNPKAGDEQHGKDDLIQKIEKAGFECRYASTKKNDWKGIDEDIDIVAAAGGDGTVRKVIREVLKRKMLDKPLPIGLLPLGTANNIAKTLEINEGVKKTAESWKEARVKRVDIGMIHNIPGKTFFLESVGFGVFPYLIKEMGELEEEFSSPEEELKACWRKLHEIVQWYEPRNCHLEVDGTDHSGKFLLVEVMNMRSIGPNMVLSPLTDPSDGELDVVLVPEAHKEKFTQYVLHKMNDGDDSYQFHTLKAKNLTIKWEGTRVHVDDKMIKMEKGITVSIEVKPGVLEFLI